MTTQSYINISGQHYLVDRDKNIWPRFTIEMRQRVRKKLALNVIIVGEGGIGKSMLAIQFAKSLDPNFDPEKQVVYTYSEYLEALLNLGKGRPIVFDEPSYSLGKRTWYMEVQQLLVKTMESQRFMQHPVFIPIISASLIDKTIRSFLIQYQVVVYARGKAIVYRLKASSFEDKTYAHTICRIEYDMLDSENCPRDGCLDCPDLDDKCQLTRAKYERKKAAIQLARYKSDRAKAETRETQNMDLDEIVEKAHSLHELFTDDSGKINVRLMRVLLKERKLSVSMTMAYDVKASLEAKYKDVYLQ